MNDIEFMAYSITMAKQEYPDTYLVFAPQHYHFFARKQAEKKRINSWYHKQVFEVLEYVKRAQAKYRCDEDAATIIVAQELFDKANDFYFSLRTDNMAKWLGILYGYHPDSRASYKYDWAPQKYLKDQIASCMLGKLLIIQHKLIDEGERAEHESRTLIVGEIWQ